VQAVEPPAAPEPPPAIEYTVMTGDSLSSIAKAHYGDPDQFQRILEANPELQATPDRLVPGQVLRIPPR
jgi:nucleoid-associated protein YgaU